MSDTPIFDRLLANWKATHGGHRPGDGYVPPPDAPTKPKARLRKLSRPK